MKPAIKTTEKRRLTSELKRRYMSNFGMQQFLLSSSADRVGRFIRENPPEGYVMKERKIKNQKHKKEFKLVKENICEMCLRETSYKSA